MNAKKTCHRCNGSGFYQETFVCFNCHGAGYAENGRSGNWTPALHLYNKNSARHEKRQLDALNIEAVKYNEVADAIFKSTLELWELIPEVLAKKGITKKRCKIPRYS